MCKNKKGKERKMRHHLQEDFYAKWVFEKHLELRIVSVSEWTPIFLKIKKNNKRTHQNKHHTHSIWVLGLGAVKKQFLHLGEWNKLENLEHANLWMKTRKN